MLRFMWNEDFLGLNMFIAFCQMSFAPPTSTQTIAPVVRVMIQNQIKDLIYS